MTFCLPHPTVGPDLVNRELIANFVRIRNAITGITNFDPFSDVGPNMKPLHCEVPIVIGPFSADDAAAPTLGAIEPTYFIEHRFSMPSFQWQDPWTIKDVLVSAKEIGGAGPDNLLALIQTTDGPGTFLNPNDRVSTTIPFTGVNGWYTSEPLDVAVTGGAGAGVNQRHMRVILQATGGGTGIWTNVTLSFTIKYLLNETTRGI